MHSPGELDTVASALNQVQCDMLDGELTRLDAESNTVVAAANARYFNAQVS
jgi:hypothetical protein